MYVCVCVSCTLSQLYPLPCVRLTRRCKWAAGAKQRRFDYLHGLKQLRLQHIFNLGHLCDSTWDVMRKLHGP